MHTNNLRLSKPRNDLFKSASSFDNERDFDELLERELDWAEVNRLLDPHLFETESFGNSSNGQSINDDNASMCIGDVSAFNANDCASTTERCRHEPLSGLPCILCNTVQAYASAKRSGLTNITQPGSSVSSLGVQSWSDSAFRTQPFPNASSSDSSYSPTPSHVDPTADGVPHTLIRGKYPITRAVSVLNHRGGPASTQRHQCATPFCASSFGRPSDLRRHEADIHAHAQKIYKCNVCGYAKRERKDKVMEHCKKRKHQGFSKIDVVENDVSGIVVSPVRTRNR